MNDFLSFSQIIGQEKAKGFLKQVIRGGKIPHSYLFTGIPGIGKTTTALAFTAALNCMNLENGENCGSCPICRQIAGRNFPDFLEIVPDGQDIRISQIRELNRRIAFPPVSGGYRVSILQQAERLNRESANSFLKTLEEPPPNNIFILSVTDPLELLPTVVSRCQRVSFQPLSMEEICGFIRSREGVDEDSADLAARLSGGSIGGALRICKEGFLEKRQRWISRVLNVPGLSRDLALKIAYDLGDEEKKASDEEKPDERLIILEMLEVWESWYRDLLATRLSCADEILINADFSGKLKKISKGLKIEGLIENLSALDRAKSDLRRMRNTKLVMEHLLLALAGYAGREPGHI